MWQTWVQSRAQVMSWQIIHSLHLCHFRCCGFAWKTGKPKRYVISFPSPFSSTPSSGFEGSSQPSPFLSRLTAWSSWMNGKNRWIWITFIPSVFLGHSWLDYPGPKGFLLILFFYLKICDAKRWSKRRAERKESASCQLKKKKRSGSRRKFAKKE